MITSWLTAKHVTLAAAVALSAYGGVVLAQVTPPAAPVVPASPSPAAPTVAGIPASDTLADLDAMTFTCPKAGLNAAAREAAKVQSQGAYQFSHFTIVNDAHHAAYAIHFKSNYAGERELKYCVEVYCQQGWDPNSKTTVTLMPNQPRRAGAATHAGSCGVHQAPAVRR